MEKSSQESMSESGTRINWITPRQLDAKLKPLSTITQLVFKFGELLSSTATLAAKDKLPAMTARY